MTQLFNLVWRNQYIRHLIRNRVCQNILKRVNKEYLEENHQYLALFSKRDKVENNIRIRFNGDASDYLDINNRDRDVINDIELIIKADFNFNEIHDGVHTLSLKFKGTPAPGMGQLPDSITNLTLIYNDETTIIQHLISNLPCKLIQLSFVNDDCIQSKCILPHTVTDLHYEGRYDSMKWLVVPPKKVYRTCTLELDSVESFQWLLENKFIGKVVIHSGSIPVLKSEKLPSHVTNVDFLYGIREPDLLLPHTVVRLCLNYGTPFSHISHLKSLIIQCDYEIKLEKGVLPQSLEDLSLSYDQPLELDVFPPSLTSLYLASFNQPLNPFVLPQKLKILCLYSFKQPTFFANSLPVSLTVLTLYEFKGSFDHCQPLDNLKRLRIDSLVPSVAGLLTNVKKLDLWVNTKISDPFGTCLVNTSIESLCLNINFKSTLYPNSFPSTIKYLSLDNVVIESDNVIPTSCTYLNFNENFEPKYIPKSVRYLKAYKNQ
ncbi:hypothetical protein CYY_000253 [Polysphondylium violaceum]|uniref:FNIP repeat-containing protein n=1 Tax=Polysphondylium violaceum TaxID=133409 RepID=A0A8J4Q215_9MYCE|nr:hypothetical protein CYY_000253 [Polysphondylium violaceum]